VLLIGRFVARNISRACAPLPYRDDAVVRMLDVTAARRPAPTDDAAARALTVAQRVAFGVLGDREAARDVAQDVALLAVRRLVSLRDPLAFDGWVRRIAVRAALREARRSSRRRAAEDAGAASAPPSRSDALDGVSALLDGLPARQRAALTLRYVHDLTDAEIARALRCRPATVRSLLARGRAGLRTRIEEERC
jgi:RNA polymerase sigma factor (sigma-70 family)